MTASLPIIGQETAAAALHGSFCPKLCNHACPVLAATGRQEAMPWAFHRTVSDLATGRRDVGDVGESLSHCTGCLGCRVPCVFDQDVPAQVRAGRAALVAGAPSDSDHPVVVAARRAVEDVGAGRSPFGRGVGAHEGRSDADARVVLVVGCRDDDATVAAAQRLLTAGGVETTIVRPDGCCGATLRDLGATGEADAQAAATAGRLDGADDVLALDPHCLPELRAAVPGARHVVVEIERLAQAGRITFDGALGPVTYHDPCLLARQERAVQEPRTLLMAAGAELVEPEHHGDRTACSGAGLGLELVAPDSAEATAARRRDHLAAGATIVTACSGAQSRLAADGTAVHDLLPLLADHLTGTAP